MLIAAWHGEIRVWRPAVFFLSGVAALLLVLLAASPAYASSDGTDARPRSGVASFNLSTWGEPTGPDAAWPNCNFRCTAGDVDMTALYIGNSIGGPLDACVAGTPVTSYLWATFNNHTGANRYAVVALADVYQNGVFLNSLSTGSVAGVCGGNTIPSNASTTQPLFSLSWVCGQPLELRNIIISWDTNAGTCADFFAGPDCANRVAKCSTNPGMFAKPLIDAGFSAAAVCEGTATQFTNLSKGGVEPVTFLWSYGDASSTLIVSPPYSNPTHTYATDGIYEVSLAMTDSSLPLPHSTDTVTQTVSVYDQPTASFAVTQVQNIQPSGGNPGTTVITFTSTYTPPATDGCNTTSWAWTIDGATTITTTTPTLAHTFTWPASGTEEHTIALAVNHCGCSTTSNMTQQIPHTGVTAVTLGRFGAVSVAPKWLCNSRQLSWLFCAGWSGKR